MVVVPVLPDRASEDLIDKLYAVLGRRPGNAVPQVEAAVAEFRRQPLDRIGGEKEAAREILQDVCLFATARTSFKMNS